jgi:hypothetical protein
VVIDRGIVGDPVSGAGSIVVERNEDFGARVQCELRTIRECDESVTVAAEVDDCSGSDQVFTKGTCNPEVDICFHRIAFRALARAVFTSVTRIEEDMLPPQKWTVDLND